MSQMTSTRHAYLIKAHNQFELLKMLIRLLDHPNHDFFIHVDSKAKDVDFGAIARAATYSRVFWSEQRLDIAWGSSSIVWCDLLLFQMANAQGPYSYYHLLSGMDLPLQTAERIYAFFEENKGKEFIHYCTDAFCRNPQQKKRVAQYHFLQQKMGRKQGLIRLVERISLLAQRCAGIDRTRAYGGKVFLGSNWCSVTQDFVTYLLEHESWIRKHFRWCCIADECYLQILTDRSAFRERLFMADPQGDYRSCMRYIDFQNGPGDGSPYTFRDGDFDRLIGSGFMFARKFDLQKHPEICFQLEQYLTQHNG